MLSGQIRKGASAELERRYFQNPRLHHYRHGDHMDPDYKNYVAMIRENEGIRSSLRRMKTCYLFFYTQVKHIANEEFFGIEVSPEFVQLD